MWSHPMVMERLNIVKMAIVHNASYTFSVIPLKIPKGLWEEIRKLILTFVWNLKWTQGAKTILEKKIKVGGLHFPFSNVSAKEQ